MSDATPPDPDIGIATPEPVPVVDSPRMSDRAVAWEVLAVLAIGFFPDLLGNLMALVDPQPLAPVPYWRDSLDRFFLDTFMSLAVLYIMYRSDEPWERYGLVRPGWRDLGLGLLLWAFVVWLWMPFVHALLPRDAIGHPELFPPPQHKLDYGLMVPKFAAGAFFEELITRAYLITRLQRLLGTKVAAVLASAFIFGSYHLYQGFWGGVASTTLLGLVFGAFYVFIPRVWPLVIAHMLYNIVLDLTP